jgi:uncharacterized membrane protein
MFARRRFWANNGIVGIRRALERPQQAWVDNATASAVRSARGRVLAIDITRGAIMALMALDHARMYFSAAQFDPTAIGETDLAYFMTRWATHLCAPGFFFLAGFSVHLAQRRGLDRGSLSVLLVARGLWLMLLEFTLIGFAWSLAPGWNWFGVIWSLGASMICLAALRWLPAPLLAIGATTFLLIHNALPMAAIIPGAENYGLLYGATEFAGRLVVFPLLPWVAVMVLGYAAGRWLAPAGQMSAPRLVSVGACSLAAFIVFRLVGFGEPEGGGAKVWPSAVDTLLSFLNVEKYPPSAQFVLVTLGLLLLAIGALTALERVTPSTLRIFAPLRVFGRVPFFFYVLHLYLIHGLALLAAVALHWPVSWLFWRHGPNLTPPDGYGATLPGVYLACFVVLLILFPACSAFARAKAGSTALWTKFL